jgi:hypothetical protein
VSVLSIGQVDSRTLARFSFLIQGTLVPELCRVASTGRSFPERTSGSRCRGMVRITSGYAVIQELCAFLISYI